MVHSKFKNLMLASFTTTFLLPAYAQSAWAMESDDELNTALASVCHASGSDAESGETRAFQRGAPRAIELFQAKMAATSSVSLRDLQSQLANPAKFSNTFVGGAIEYATDALRSESIRKDSELANPRLQELVRSAVTAALLASELSDDSANGDVIRYVWYIAGRAFIALREYERNGNALYEEFKRVSASLPYRLNDNATASGNKADDGAATAAYQPLELSSHQDD